MGIERPMILHKHGPSFGPKWASTSEILFAVAFLRWRRGRAEGLHFDAAANVSYPPALFHLFHDFPFVLILSYS